MTSESLDYNTAQELLTRCDVEQFSIAKLALAREAKAQNVSKDALFGQMREHYRSMRASVRQGLEIDQQSPSKLSGGDARKLLDYSRSGSALSEAGLAKTPTGLKYKSGKIIPETRPSVN